jgi:hypothetical protein
MQSPSKAVSSAVPSAGYGKPAARASLNAEDKGIFDCQAWIMFLNLFYDSEGDRCSQIQHLLG